MIKVGSGVAILAAVCLGIFGLGDFVGVQAVSAAEEAKNATAKPDAPKEEITEQKFLSAAYAFCATTQNRDAKSCECEQKLIVDKNRVSLEDRVMAYYFWVDKEQFRTRYQAKAEADPEFRKEFGQRFSMLQALIISACGA